MLRRILVPVDVEQDWIIEPAVAEAGRLAAALPSELFLLYVLPDVPLGYLAPEMRSAAYERLKYIAAQRMAVFATRHAQGIAAKMIVREGSPANQILAVAKEVDADLIVMSSHVPGLSDYILGSVAGKVLRYANCSVLIVRDKQVPVTSQ